MQCSDMCFELVEEYEFEFDLMQCVFEQWSQCGCEFEYMFEDCLLENDDFDEQCLWCCDQWMFESQI